MSSAAARAEARRKAILGRGSDRLSKLTTSARGEDQPAYSSADIPSRKAPTTETFVGDESIMPTPPVRDSPAPEPSRINNGTGGLAPSAWTTEQQQEFMRALMSAPELNGTNRNSSQPFNVGQAPFQQGAGDDPMATLLNALTQTTGQSNLSGIPPQAVVAVPRSLYSKLRPLLHLVASWMLLAFFAVFMEPKAYEDVPGSHVSSTWERWAELSWRNAKKPFGVQPVQFFWAFVTLQLLLHSIQIFTKADRNEPPTLLAMAMPALPPRFRTIITNLLAYVRMGGMLLDDVAGLVVGIGILIWVSSWLAVGQ